MVFRVGAVKELLEMGVEFGLIGLDGQHIVSLLFDDLLGRALIEKGIEILTQTGFSTDWQLPGVSAIAPKGYGTCR